MERLLSQVTGGVDCGYLVIVGVLIGAGLLRSVQSIPGIPLDPPGQDDDTPDGGEKP